MGSKVAEEHGNTENEEGTIAFQKKRSRRVSFAEITSVHVFDRDEDYEIPPDSKQPSSETSELGQSNEDLGFHRDPTDGEDSKDSLQNGEEDDYDDEELKARRSFLRPTESPSPGSTIGSATSNDEDNFFGPVSASFIRPGRLSDSAVSDENCDITMDSTAFSMHFHSLARSDLGGDLKTPTRVHLSFDEKTPFQNTIPTNLGSSMVLTVSKKPLSQSYMPVEKLSGSTDSNDMSLVGENPHRYDYGRLSPGLDALLAEGSKDLHTLPISDNISISQSPINIESQFSPLKKLGNGPLELNVGRDEKRDDSGNNDMLPAEAASVSLSKNWSPNQSTKDILLGKSNESAIDAFEMRRPDLDFSSAKSGTLSNLDNNGLHLHVPAPSEHESPLAGLISSFSAKQRQTFLDNVSPSKFPWNGTPFQKQLGSFVRDESRKHSESVASIQKSISKLKMLEASPFSSALKAKIDSNLISSVNLFKTPPFNTVLEKNNKDAQAKHVDASVTYFEEQLSSIAQKNGEQKSTIDMDSNDIEMSPNIVDLSHTEGSVDLVKGGKSPNHLSTGILCRDQHIKLMATAASPSQFTSSGKKTHQRLLMLQDPVAGTSVTSRTDSSVEFTIDYIKDKKATDTPHKFVASPEKRLEKKSITSQEYKDSLSRDLRLHDQYKKLLSFGPGQDADSSNNVTNARLADKLESLFMGRALSSSPFTGLNHSKDFNGVERADDREIKLHDVRDESGTIGNCQNHLTDKETDPAIVHTDLPGGEIKASRGSASPFVHRPHNKPPIQKNLVEMFTHSPSREELYNATQHDDMHSFVVEDVISPNSSQLTKGFENSARKRRGEEMIHKDGDHLDEIARIQRSPKLHKGGSSESEFLSEHPNKCNDETSMIKCDTRLKHWADVLSKFSGDTKQLLSPLIDKQSLRAIGVLEDIVVQLYRSRIYEMLCTEIRSQKTFDHLSNLQHKRVAETRLLLHRIMLEQATLQLMSVKRERLLVLFIRVCFAFQIFLFVSNMPILCCIQKKVQLVRSGIQESQVLNLNFLPHLSLLRAGDAQVEDNHLQFSSVDFKGIKEVACDDVTAMRQVLEASDREIVNLTKSFHTSCKMKGEPSCADTVVLVNDHLKKRTCCRFLRLDLQLWEVDNLESRNGHRNIVLNYLGVVTQRLKTNVGPVSSIVISSKVNEINIVKNFPSMDACTAFAFVLNANTTQKHIGPRSLTQEIQITSSLLGNLLDVVEEVQLAQEELQTLIQTSFHSSSVEQLDLQLCFIDFKSGRKVLLTLDVSCLNRGVYPLEIIPSQFEAPADISQKLLPQPPLAEIRAAVLSLRVGYLRILRLCRCVSQVVQAWSI
ncbi:hypothetical protein F0562_008153 [Nyssa sinensis]|uniref:Knl1 C-terminal RWD domain-containing protein n=1 Tax=Nyssa sinensis TaxID=561372 RepID=A0A5J5A8U0_9ASTE|nr:hypothetical protein F0562_008153 [Nyssa sinensis]